MTLSDMIRFVRKITKDRLASDRVISQEEYIPMVLNESIIPDFIGRHPWFFKTQVVTSQAPKGTYMLQMPQTLQDVRLAIMHTGELGTTRKLKFQPMQQFFDYIPDPAIETEGFWEWYTWTNRQIWFDRPLLANYAARFVGLLRPNRLVNMSDVPEWLDEDKHMLLVYGACGFIYTAMEDTKNGQVWFNVYEQGVKTYWDESENKQDADIHLGKFLPQEMDSLLTTDPIKSPFVRRFNS